MLEVRSVLVVSKVLWLLELPPAEGSDNEELSPFDEVYVSGLLFKTSELSGRVVVAKLSK